MRTEVFGVAKALVFPGQGSQKPGMGQDFYDAIPESRDVFAQASAATGLNIEELCFTENESLDLTEFTQPCILTCEIAMLEGLRARYGLQADFYAGHSLGEYTALVAAGVIGLAQAVQIVRKRGALMQAAVAPGAGAMAALKQEGILAQKSISDLIRDSGAQVANLNSPDQIVISGPKAGVEHTISRLASEFPDVEAIPLTVSAPFHSELMQPIEAEFRTTLESFADSFKTERATAVLSNFSGTFHRPETLIDHLVQQISGSVLWTRNMEVLAEVASEILEIGPNRPLGAFFRAMGVEAKSILNLRSAEKALA